MLWTANGNTLQAVDAATGKPKGAPIDLKVPEADPYPKEIVVAGDTVWVNSSRYVTAVDAASGKVVGQPRDANNFIRAMVADENAAYVAVSPPADKGSATQILRIDGKDSSVRFVQLGPERGIFFAQMDVAGGRLWITQSQTAYERGKKYTQDTGTVTRLDAATLAGVGRPTPISPEPSSLSVGPDTAWIVDTSGDIAVVDTRTGARRPSPAPLPEPGIVEVTDTLAYIWERGGRLHAFDQKSSEPAGDARDVKDHPGAIELTDSSIWLLDEPTQDPEADDEPPWSVMRLDR